MTKGICFLIFLFLINRSLISQEPDSLRRWIHQLESEFYSTVTLPAPAEIEKAYLSYDYNSLSHIAYFSYEVDTATGGYTYVHELPSEEISMAAPDVDWNVSWDINSLARLCDYLIIMGYDYYWSGSTTAGPVAPLDNESYNVTRSVNTYLLAGVSAEKLISGVPWYGYDWPVVSSARKAAATGTATSRFYTSAKSLAKTNGSIFDQPTGVPWVKYQGSSLWRQLWYDDTVTF